LHLTTCSSYSVWVMTLADTDLVPLCQEPDKWYVRLFIGPRRPRASNAAAPRSTRQATQNAEVREPIMTDNRTQVFDVAMKNARTIEACIDRLSMMGADHELKLVAQRLSRLTFRLRHQPSKVRKGWAQPQSSAAA
jgi:hypothetical protein